MKQDTNVRNYAESWFACWYIPCNVLLLSQEVLHLIMISLFSVIFLPIIFSLSLLTIIGEEWLDVMFHKYKVSLLQITLVTIVFSVCTIWPLSDDMVPFLLNGNPSPFLFPSYLTLPLGILRTCCKWSPPPYLLPH